MNFYEALASAQAEHLTLEREAVALRANVTADRKKLGQVEAELCKSREYGDQMRGILDQIFDILGGRGAEHFVTVAKRAAAKSAKMEACIAEINMITPHGVGFGDSYRNAIGRVRSALNRYEQEVKEA